jgi:hypothetical protein
MSAYDLSKPLLDIRCNKSYQRDVYPAFTRISVMPLFGPGNIGIQIRFAPSYLFKEIAERVNLFRTGGCKDNVLVPPGGPEGWEVDEVNFRYAVVSGFDWVDQDL